MKTPALFLTLPLLPFLMPCVTAPAQEPPFDVGLEEQIDVQLVLVDFLVLDGDDRTVADLTLDDFNVVVNGRDMTIASLDLDCPAGATEDPRPDSDPLDVPSAPTAGPRRLVIVFDYLHMTNVTETLDQAVEALDTWAAENDEHMVVSLGNVVRIESPLTRDLDQTRRSIERMQNDLDLYAGNYNRLTETRYFDRVRMIFDLLERVPGRKSIVMFSGPFQPDGFDHDPSYRALSALAATTRTSIYAVDSGGLRVLTDPLVSRLGGPPMLRRMAVDTGGRMVADTNAIGLVYRKAQRDLGCTYTIGFYDDRVRPDKARRMTLRVEDRPGLRVVYPEFYVIRSPAEKQKSLFRTATMLPQMFDSHEMNIDLFVVGPRSTRRWQTVLAIEIRPDAQRVIEPGAAWLLRGTLRKTNGTILHSFKRRVTLPSTGGALEKLTLFQTIDVAAGSYLVSAVLADPGGEPLAASRPAVVPPIPTGRAFLVGPLLGRQATTETDPHRSRAAYPEFEPLIQPEAIQGEPLETMTLVCVVGARDATDVWAVGRTITTFAGESAHRFEPISLRLDSAGSGVLCHRVLDRVATASLQPGRYALTAVVETAEEVTGNGSVEFTIKPRSGSDSR